MFTKKIWITSKYPWVATLHSLNPNGDTSWFSLSKSSGEANYPAGEFIDVIIVGDFSYNKNGYINVISNSNDLSTVIKVEFVNVCTWSSFVRSATLEEQEVATMLVAINTKLGIERTYNLLSAFSTLPAITVKQWQEMSAEQLSARIAAFKSYINALEAINIDDMQANNVFRTALKLRLLSDGGMRIIQENNLRISI